MDKETLNKVRSDVDEMNKSFGLVPVDNEEDDKEEVNNDPNPESSDTPESDSDNTDGTEEDSTDEEKSEEGEEEKEENKEEEIKLDEKDRTIAELRSRLDEKEVTTKPIKQELEIEEQDFLGDQDPEELLTDKGGLNKLLNKIYQQGLSDSVKMVNQSIPSQVAEIISVSRKLEELNTKFYNENEDLKGFMKTVAVVYGELTEDDPKKSMEDILKATAPEVRKRLGLPTPVKKSDTPKDDPPPKLPTKKRSSGREPESKPLTGVSAEIDSMNKTLRG